MAFVPSDYLWGRYPSDAPDCSFVNTNGTALTPGQLVMLDTGNLLSSTQGLAGMKLTAAVTDSPDGVVVEDVPNKYAGRMQISGVAVCIAAGAITAGAWVGASGATSGDVTTTTATDPYFGKSWSTAGTLADPVLVHVAPGVTA